MPTLPMLRDAYMATLWTAYLLCDVCQNEPWTQRALWHDVVVCAGCAIAEPAWEDQ